MIRYALFWGLSIAIAAAVRAWEGRLTVGFAADSVVLAGLGAAFCGYRPVRHYLAEGLPRVHRRFAIGLLFLILTGHLLDRPFQTFPFVNWNMFGGGVMTVGYYRYEARTTNGEEVVVVPGAAFPPLGQGTWRVKISLDELAKTAFASGDPGHAPERLARMLRAVGREYNRRHPDASLTELRVVHCRFDVYPVRENRELLLELPIE